MLTILFEAIENNDFASVEQLIREAKQSPEFTLNALNQNGDTPLIYAIKKGQEEIANMLIAEGANVNISNGKRTPLDLVARNKKCTITSLLLTKGADFYVMDDYKKQLLSHAVSNNQPALVEFLIKKGCDVNARRGNLLYSAAVSGQSRKMFKLLIDAGADITFEDTGKNTLLHITAEKGTPESAQLLIEKGLDINAINKEGHTPVRLALRSSKMLQSFIDAGADMTFEDTEKNTLLHLAVIHCFSKTVKVLIRHGMAIDALNKKGQTPLLMARSFKTVKALIDGGADVKAEDIKKNTSLHHAAKRDCLKSVQLLFEADVDINAKNKKGQTSLCLAMLHKSPSIIEFLINNGSATFNHTQDLIALIEDRPLKLNMLRLRNDCLKKILQNVLPPGEKGQKLIATSTFIGFVLFTAPRIYIWQKGLKDLNAILQVLLTSEKMQHLDPLYLRRLRVALFYLQTHQLRESNNPLSIVQLLIQRAIINPLIINQEVDQQLERLDLTHKQQFSFLNPLTGYKSQLFFNSLFKLPPELFEWIDTLGWSNTFILFIQSKLPEPMKPYCAQWIPYLMESKKAKEHLKPWCQRGCPIMESSFNHKPRLHACLS